MNFFPKYLGLNYGSLMMRESGEAVGRETPVGIGLVFLKEQDQPQPLLRKKKQLQFPGKHGHR